MLFGLSLYLTGTAFASGNPYSFLFSSLIISVLVILATVARVQASRLRRARTEWDTSEPIYARRPASSHRVLITGFTSLPFFRLHFILHGALSAGRDARFRYHRETSGTGETIDVPLRFPVCGVFHGQGSMAIKDVFGLTRGALENTFTRSIVVRPALISDRDTPKVQAQRGDENQSRMKSSDIERYFMREYIPGDRHRDINWKASSRFSELFTRISPVTQEKTKIITVHFRPYTSMKSDSLRSVFFLDQSKSALLYFLRAIKKEHGEYNFSVFVGNDLRELETEDDIDAFSTEIASTHFRNPRGEEITNPDDLHPGDVFIFTTAYDTGLPTFLSASMPGSQVHIHRVVIPERGKASRPKTRRSLWDGTDEPLLGGRWILRTDPLSSNPGIGVSEGVLLEDDPLEVKIV
jgi:uncharacterized protein (DUF58 family)